MMGALTALAVVGMLGVLIAVNGRHHQQRRRVYEELARELDGWVDGRHLEVHVDGLAVSVTIGMINRMSDEATLFSLYDPMPDLPDGVRDRLRTRLEQFIPPPTRVSIKSGELELAVPGSRHDAAYHRVMLERVRSAALMDELGDAALRAADGLRYEAPAGPYHARIPPHAVAAAPTRVTVGPVVRDGELITLAELHEPLPWERPVTVADARRSGMLPAAAAAHAGGLDELVLMPSRGGRVVLRWPAVEREPRRLTAGVRLLQGLVAGAGSAYR